MINKGLKIVSISLFFILILMMTGCTIEVDNLNTKITNNLDKVKDKVNQITEIGEGLAFSDQYDRVESFSESYKGTINSLKIDNKVGAIHIYKGNSNDLIINYNKKVKSRSAFESEISKAMESITIDLIHRNNELEIKVNITKDIENIFKNRSVEFEIFIPISMKEIYVENSVGATEIEGISTDFLKADISVGELKVSNAVIGDASLHTSTGSIRINNSKLNGKITTSTGSVDIQGGKLNKDTTISASTGSIYVATEFVKDGNFDFSSRTGSIKTYVPENYSFQLDAQTSIGDIETDINFKDIYTKKGIFIGKSGDGGAIIKLRTDVGSIKINKL